MATGEKRAETTPPPADPDFMKEMRQMKSELVGLMSLFLKDVMRKMDQLSREIENTKQDLSREIKHTQAGVVSNGQQLENLVTELKRIRDFHPRRAGT